MQSRIKFLFYIYSAFPDARYAEYRPPLRGDASSAAALNVFSLQIRMVCFFARVIPEVDVEAVVAQIIADVRKGKDRAVIEYCRRFDRVDLRSLEVTKEEIEEAKTQVTPDGMTVYKKSYGGQATVLSARSVLQRVRTSCYSRPATM